MSATKCLFNFHPENPKTIAKDIRNYAYCLCKSYFAAEE